MDSAPQQVRAVGLDICSMYQLPGKPGDIHVLPVSGGADSSALSILMHQLFPDQEFILMFTDTKAEGKELYASLDRLEAYLGKKITRIVPSLGLYELVERYGGFLPSSQSRYCTRELKLKPFEAFVKSLRPTGTEQIHTYVGIRADEKQRVGLVSHEDFIHTHMPFRDLGIGRAEVFKILEKTIGVPRFYQYRTRSGCVACPFQRRGERIGLLFDNPAEFAEGAQYEKLTNPDQHAVNPESVAKESGIALNWLTLPVPERIDSRTHDTALPVKWGVQRRNHGNVIDLFDTEPMSKLWVGAEFFVNPAVGGSGVWHHRLVSVSSTRNGIERQMQKHYEHRIQTPEVYGLDEAGMKDELKLAVYYIEVSSRLMVTDGPGEGSFTWYAGESYAQLAHLVAWASRVLHAAGLESDERRYAKFENAPLSWGYEQLAAVRKGLESLRMERGRLIAMDRFDPVDRIEEETDERLVACFHCSI